MTTLDLFGICKSNTMHTCLHHWYHFYIDIKCINFEFSIGFSGRIANVNKHGGHQRLSVCDRGWIKATYATRTDTRYGPRAVYTVTAPNIAQF